jgi:hypothetical protein
MLLASLRGMNPPYPLMAAIGRGTGYYNDKPICAAHSRTIEISDSEIRNPLVQRLIVQLRYTY